MISSVLQFFNLRRKIFGVCPRSGQFFRLSDCALFTSTPPQSDWLDKLDASAARLDLAEQQLQEREETLREAARRQGRRLAQALARKIDSVFTPRRLDPDDAKVLFHPVDYLVFRGMKSGPSISDLIFLDRETRDTAHRQVQRSIEKVIERGQYEWLTLRVKDDGTIEEE
jgi:predicted Holliday junction resolvase-like endonuclease